GDWNARTFWLRQADCQLRGGGALGGVKRRPTTTQPHQHLLLCKSNIARISSFSVSRLPVKSNRALQEEQRAFKNISSGSDSMINSGLSSILPVFHILERINPEKTVC